MTDLLQTGVAWLDVQRKAYLSRLVTYQRGLDTVSVEATLIASEEEIFPDPGGVTMRAKRTDFVVTAADLVLDGVAVAPESGDRIVLGAVIYEVLALAGGEYYRKVDPSGVLIKIHAKQVHG